MNSARWCLNYQRRAVDVIRHGGEAERLYKRALAIDEKVLGPNHPKAATALNNLASLYSKLGRYADAEPLSKRSLSINENVLGLSHPDVATSLNTLASLYEAQGRYADAEPLYKRSLAIREKALDPDHPDVAASLSNLAGLTKSTNIATPTPSRCTSAR
jgi:tetratricopeptide (TPR) repeat protein